MTAQEQSSTDKLHTALADNTHDSSADEYVHGDALNEHQLVTLQHLDLQSVASNYPKLQLLLSGFISSVIAIAGSIFVVTTTPFSLPHKLLVIGVLFAIAALFTRLIYLKALRVKFGVFAHEFVSRKGLFWIATTALPYTRLQHVNLSQGPLERKFNLISLKCFSAGSGEAEIDLPGLNAEYAEHLRQHLLKQAADLQQNPDQTGDVLAPTLIADEAIRTNDSIRANDNE